MSAQWVKWKNGGGPRVRGNQEYNPPQPWGPWTKILGVVARCEGNHDTVVMYDETAVTFGFMQWTFTSGRLQRLLQSFKAVQVLDYTTTLDGQEANLFDALECNAKFRRYGFVIQNGKFVDADRNAPLNPANKVQRNRMVDICMGRSRYKDFKQQKNHAMQLAETFADLGKDFAVAHAQIAFAKQEFKQGLPVKRHPLGKVETLENLLEGTWETPAPALFYNLCQNNPKYAYKMFLNVKASGATGEDYFDLAWKKTNRSKFGNWGWGKPENKSPRVVRIKQAMKEFYGIDLPYYK